MTHGTEHQPNAASQPSVTETTVNIKGLGEVSIISQGDFGPNFDPERAVGSMFDGQGKYVPMQRMSNSVYEVPGQGLVAREQPTYTHDRGALREHVRQQTREVSTLRGLGLTVVNHVSAIVPVNNIDQPHKMGRRPSIITLSQKLSNPGEKIARLNVHDPADASKAAKITQIFQKYYTDDLQRPHLVDVAGPHQFSKDGVLLDVDISFTEPVGTGPVTEYETCGRQLRLMYKDFKLTPDEIADLKRNSSFDPRQRIEINRPGENPEADTTALGLLAQLMKSYHDVQAKVEEAQASLQIAIESAQDAEDLMRGTGEWVGRERPNVDATNREWEAARQGMENINDLLDQTVESMWATFPKI